MTERVPSWTPKQQARLAALMEAERAYPDVTWIGYWASDSWGRSANGGGHDIERAAPGVVHRLDGDHLEICTERGLHATRVPHQWRGARVWIVALLGQRVDERNKSASLTREIIGEVLPDDVICPMVAARMGIDANLTGADLSCANLYCADLYRANLSHANLSHANLSHANLSHANLSHANLIYADLTGANLSGANLTCADLTGASLSDANLSCADMYCANLSRADLSHANLSGANLTDANLTCASLSDANLTGADLSHANLYCANLFCADRPHWLPDLWVVTRTGLVIRREP